MPVTYVHIEWPDHKVDRVYSPSSVIKDYFKPGEDLLVDVFLAACTKGLNNASERVRQKFGYACTSGMAELQRISNLCQDYDNSKKVKIVSIK